MSIKTIKEKVLVIGKTGQVASELFVLQPHWIYTDRSVCDLSDPKTFEKQLLNHIESTKPTILVNASAYTKVDLAEEESSLCDNINHHAVQVMAKLCRDQKIKFIHLSTDYVFDGCKNTPYKENDWPSPQKNFGNHNKSNVSLFRIIVPFQNMGLSEVFIFKLVRLPRPN